MYNPTISSIIIQLSNKKKNMLVLHQFTSSHHRDVTGAPQRSSFQVGGIREVRAPRIVNGLPGLVISYSLRTGKWHIEVVDLPNLNDGHFPVRYVKNYQRVFGIDRRIISNSSGQLSRVGSLRLRQISKHEPGLQLLYQNKDISKLTKWLGKGWDHYQM